MSSMRRESSRKTRAPFFLGRMATRVAMPTKTPTVMPTSELILVRNAKTREKAPIANAGMKILKPSSP